VLVNLDGRPEKPTASPTQSMCGGVERLEDLTIHGYGIVWFDDQMKELPSSTILEFGQTYYAAQSSGDCVGDTLGIKIVNCFTIEGTVFPFVHRGNDSIDAMFPVMVKLYAVPAIKSQVFLFTETHLFVTQASLYDGTTDFIEGTPKLPGAIGRTNNPGLPIFWAQISKAAGIPIPLTLTPSDPIPSPSNVMGKYRFENIPAGNYLLVISRPGYLTRIGKIEVNANKHLGHREILPGDVDGNCQIIGSDLTAIRGALGRAWPDKGYRPQCDMDGNGIINIDDINFMYFNNGATYLIYQETRDW